MGRHLILVDNRAGRLEFVDVHKRGQQYPSSLLLMSVTDIDDFKLKCIEHNKAIDESAAKLYVERTIQSPTLWNLSLVTDSDYDTIKKSYEDQDWKTIMTIHNDKELTRRVYCCDSYIPEIVMNVKRMINVRMGL